MEVGYAFLNIKPGEKRTVIRRLKEIDGVKEAHIVLGIFDVIIRIDAETIEEIEGIYFNKIEKIPNITSCRLHIAACPRTRK